MNKGGRLRSNAGTMNGRLRTSSGDNRKISNGKPNANNNKNNSNNSVPSSSVNGGNSGSSRISSVRLKCNAVIANVRPRINSNVRIRTYKGGRRKTNVVIPISKIDLSVSRTDAASILSRPSSSARTRTYKDGKRKTSDVLRISKVALS